MGVVTEYADDGPEAKLRRASRNAMVPATEAQVCLYDRVKICSVLHIVYYTPKWSTIHVHAMCLLPGSCGGLKLNERLLQRILGGSFFNRLKVISSHAHNLQPVGI